MRMLACLVVLALATGLDTPAHAQTLSVTTTLHEAKSITNADGGGDDDIYWKVSYSPVDAAGDTQKCSSKPEHVDGDEHIFPNWQCTANWGVSPLTDPGATVQVDIELWEHDGTLFTGDDDHFDIHPDPSKKDIRLFLDPVTQQVMIPDIPGFQSFGCVAFPLEFSGANGDDRARVRFSVTASQTADGDSDGDGLQDAWELCGFDADADETVDVDLPGLGADPFRKDLFVEIDWFVDDDGIGAPNPALVDHSHEPWLPSLLASWTEYAQAPVTNPPDLGGNASQNGVALHLDVGDLYDGYSLDFNGDGVAEITAPPNGDIDLNGDGVTDIGNLGGGNQICADLSAPPCAGGEWRTLTAPDATTARSNNFDEARDLVFHYAIFAHERGACDTTSGVAPWGSADFVVMLETPHPGCTGGWTRMGGLVGPSGLPVDGSIGEHTGTFLHELGHSVSLGHGGGDGLNNKPNYLSIMSYTYQIPGVQFDLNGDGVADPLVGFDRDQDGQPDPSLYMYSTQALAALNEGALNEPAGIGDGNTIITFGPATCDADGDGVCDICGVNAQTGLGNTPIDWNRDGDVVDLGVATLAAAPNPPTDLNRNCVPGDTLTGFSDWTLMRNGGLAQVSAGDPTSGLTKQAYDRQKERTQRITGVPDLDSLAKRCIDPVTADFEGIPLGDFDANTYGPELVITAPEGPDMQIVGPPGRDGAPTQSPDQSFTLGESSGDHPVRMVFDEPRRYVGFHTGSTTPLDRPVDVTIEAWDTDGLSMGSHVFQVAPGIVGITQFAGIAAVFNGQLIRAVQVRTNKLIDVHLDDIVHCGEQRPPDDTLDVPDIPEFGDLDVRTSFEAQAILEVEKKDPEDPDHVHYEIQQLLDVPIEVQGSEVLTAAERTDPEGTVLTVEAPMSFARGNTSYRFLHWRLGEGTNFPEDHATIEHHALRDGRLTAVYYGEPRSCSCACDHTGAGPLAAPFGLAVLLLWWRRRRASSADG